MCLVLRTLIRFTRKIIRLYVLCLQTRLCWLEHFYTMKLGWNEYVATILNMALNLVTEFLYDRFVVFRDSIDTNDIARKQKAKEEVK